MPGSPSLRRWPVNTEAEGSLHIKEKSAAKSHDLFGLPRPRRAPWRTPIRVYWEEVEPRSARRSANGQRLSGGWDRRHRPLPRKLRPCAPGLQRELASHPRDRSRHRSPAEADKASSSTRFDPYAVRPEDALEAARREVKQWRMDQLATVKRQHHLDPLTEWYVLAWDAFRAPRFPADEALKLARVVGLDFDQQVKKNVCEVKGDDVILWDSLTRQRKGKLGLRSRSACSTRCHWAAKIGPRAEHRRRAGI